MPILGDVPLRRDGIACADLVALAHPFALLVRDRVVLGKIM